MPFSDQINVFSEELIAESAPTYWSYDRAGAYLLGVTDQGGWNVSTRELVVRRQDHAARIIRVVIDQTAGRLVVEVEGERLRDATVELAGDIPGGTQRLSGRRHQTVGFAIPNGLPPQPWLLLRGRRS